MSSAASSGRLLARDWFALLHRVSQQEGKRTAITTIVGDFFAERIASNQFEDVLCALHLFDNSIARPEEGVELNVGEALVHKALAVVCRDAGRPMDAKRVKDAIKVHGDAGEWAQANVGASALYPCSDQLLLSDVFDALTHIARCTGPKSQERKVDLIVQLIGKVQCYDRAVCFTVRTLLCKLRIGATIKSIIASLALAIASRLMIIPPGLNKARLKEAQKEVHALADAVCESCTGTQNFEQLVSYARLATLDELRTAIAGPTVRAGQPVQPMLAKPTTSVAEILAKFDGSPIVAQFKYDGERAQIHWNAETQEMFVFSRNGENSTAKYASVRDALLASLRDRRDSCVIDGEMLAVELLPDGSRRILPFQTLMKRAKKERAKDSARAAKASEEEAQVMYVAFDMLLLGDTCLTGRQLYERHLCLQSALVPVTGAVEIAEQIVSSDPNEIMVFLDQSVSAGCEGLMIKATDSAYEPSRRSSHWLKLKKDYLDGMGDTLDLVPVGAWLGRGKRHGAFGSYLMACYNAATNAYESIACVGTGMSEDEMRNFQTLFSERGLCRESRPANVIVRADVKPDVWIVPGEVWEIKAADLTLSHLHAAAQDFLVRQVGEKAQGISLRFPRFVRARPDKSCHLATTNRQVMQMYLDQSTVHRHDSVE